MNPEKLGKYRNGPGKTWKYSKRHGNTWNPLETAGV
jgi:hypothetical protein